MRRAVEFLSRHAAAPVVDAMSDTRVVVINGARQVGKSTLAESVLRGMPDARTQFLDDPGTRAAAAADPVRFVRHDGPMLIDEVQRVPELWLAIKNLVDREPRPGRFLLTGSARLLSLRSLPDLLPGRSETIELWPLSQGEIDGTPDRFVDAAFTTGGQLRVPPSPLRRRDYLARVARGGFPEAVHRETPQRRERFFRSYVADVITRDVHQVADIEQAGDMRRLISLLAAQSGGLMRHARFANDLSITAPTIKNYIDILETIYLIRLIPAWASGATARVVSLPKVIFVDSGLATSLSTGALGTPPVGALLEGFVLGELARQLTWADTDARIYHYRDRDQYEVDAVLEDNAGYLVGVEVKAAETVRDDDFVGLRRLQRRLGERFRAGFVLYCGPDSLSFGDGLTCLPISALWTAAGQPGGVSSSLA